MNPKHLTVGMTVVVTNHTMETMKNGNRSIKVYPSTDYIEKMSKYIGIKGMVERVFPPGYEFNLKFPDGQVFHCKDNYVEVVN